MKYFTKCTTLDELKKEYRRLTMIHHPDHGGDTATMQDINAEYADRFQVLKNQHNAKADEHHKTTEAPEEFINIINALIKFPGIIVELCGSWLWISGDTRPVKDELKAAGCRWSKNKGMWYWHHAEDGSSYHRGSKTIGEIRMKYGSQTFKNTTEYITA